LDQGRWCLPKARRPWLLLPAPVLGNFARNRQHAIYRLVDKREKQRLTTHYHPRVREAEWLPDNRYETVNRIQGQPCAALQCKAGPFAVLPPPARPYRKAEASPAHQAAPASKAL